MAINETLSQVDLGAIGNSISYLPRKITEEIVNFLTSHNLPVSQRWAGLCVVAITLFLSFLAIKIAKPLIKFILWALAIILAIGIILPNW